VEGRTASIVEQQRTQSSAPQGTPPPMVLGLWAMLLGLWCPSPTTPQGKVKFIIDALSLHSQQLLAVASTQHNKL
jgi:hypothetical protein